MINESELKNKIKALFLGQAIGDAMGLGTEFLTKSEIKEYYPKGLKFFNEFVRDKHRSRWEEACWTDDTDQFLCICKSIISHKSVKINAFAEELEKWFKGKPMGIGKTVNSVLSLPQFVLFPHKASELVWKMGRKNVASNGAIMRTSIVGAWHFWDWETVKSNTENIAKVTHWDPRCVGSCVIVTYLVSEILKGNENVDRNDLRALAKLYDERILEFIDLSENPNLEDYELDDKNTWGYTLKTLSVVLWAYYHANSFEETLYTIIHQGGDADTNASVALSVLGAKLGLENIPKDFINGLKNKEELNYYLEAFIALLDLKQ